MTATGSRWLAVLLLSIVTLALLGTTPARAHTTLAEARPAGSEVVDQPIEQVELVFDDALAPEGDHEIGVFGPDGTTRVDDGVTTSPAPDRIAVGLEPGITRAGTHTVRWVVVAADGDEQRGEYTFEATPSAIVPDGAEGEEAGPVEEVSEPASDASATDDPPADQPAPDDAGDAPAAVDEPDPAGIVDRGEGALDGDDGGTPVVVVVALAAAAAVVATTVASRRGRD